MNITVTAAKQGPSVGKIALHTALVLLTGGLWLIPLLVRWLLK